MTSQNRLIKNLSVDFLQATQYFMEKSDRHDQWNVLNLLTYNFGIKDNFEQGGIVPLTLAGTIISYPSTAHGVVVVRPPCRFAPDWVRASREKTSV